MAARQRLTVFLLENVADFSDALETPSTPSVDVRDAIGIDAAFFWRSRPASRPAWVNFIEPALVQTPDQLTSSSASGLLLLRESERVFALTFGFGRTLLDLTKVVRQFGLRVALNTIDHEQIRSMDTKTFEDMVVSRNTQVSRSTQLPVFGVDVARDILRAVTGEPRDKQRYGKRVSGADAAVLNLDVAPAELPGVCRGLLEAYQDTAYRERFSWVDDLAIVQDKARLEALDEALTDQLRNADTSSTHMAMPESVAWEDVDVFRIAGTRSVEYGDLDLDEYLTNLGANTHSLTPAILRSRSVSIRFARSDEFESRWRLYDCLVSEQRLEGKLFVLIEGRWFEVSPTLASRVDAFAEQLEHTPVPLLPAVRGEHEGAYNVRLAQMAAQDRLCLDAEILRPEGATSGIEFCDVLSSDGTLLHVKRKSRSSTLSHLFAQGVVSATTLLGDEEFRARLSTLITPHIDGTAGRWKNLIPDGNQAPERDGLRVSYVVIANSSKPGNGWLPFFSKLNLMQSARVLSNLGVKVTLDRVDVQ